MKSRIVGLDIFRGYAIVLMIFFHLTFDLNNFDYISIDIRGDAFWKNFRFFIVSMFVFGAGMSLKLAHYQNISYQKIKKRIFILALASLAVSIGSYTQFANSWIYFGVLHFMLFASLVGLLFLKIPKLALIFALFIILGYLYNIINMHWLFIFLQKPLHLPLHRTEDLVSLTPWFGVFLLGIVFASYNLHQKTFTNSFFESKNRINRILSIFGKHSLLIYLIHQPIIFALLLSIP